MVYTSDLKSDDCKVVRVRVPPSAPVVTCSELRIWRDLAEAKGLSQEKLARLADIANNTLIKMESGENQNPRLGTLKKVAKAFGVSVDKLIL